LAIIAGGKKREYRRRGDQKKSLKTPDLLSSCSGHD